ncbi:MAG: ATP-dependent DNA helicase [Chitinophagales bacterium]|nr:ATP-dependent DNA helicase [Chitinophagales bacterium]
MEIQQGVNHQDIFEQELAKLNERQREAVEAIEGPVMVIAGPGTGKTQILAARIGNILRSTDSQPENILCLTYTDAGALAMRKRLLRFIGPDAYKVEICTFHAFCNKVIKENMDVFGIRALDAITELEQISLFRELVDSFDAKHPLKRWTGDVYYETSRLKRLFQLMKTEGWSPEMICQKCEEYIAALPTRPEFIYKRANAAKGIKIGDPKQDDIDKRKRMMEVLQAACQEYPRFLKMMAERKRYDFDDMILLTLNKFREDKDLLLTYQERYHYFLVDEYQDTNGAQNEVLQMLVSYWDVPNVFVVGDDDQSIYRFQGANIENILSFSQAYQQHLKVVVLTDNYRSSQHILDLSRKLIETNQQRLINVIEGLHKDLQAKNTAFAFLENQPEIREYYNTAHETVGIALEIEQLQMQGVDLNEIAVIYRNHRQSEAIARYLEAKGIPINIRRKADLLQSPFIKNILQLLRYVDGEAKSPYSREDLLFEMLHYSFFRIEPLFVARMAAELRNKTGDSLRVTWRDEIRNATAKIDRTLFADSRNNDNYVNLKRLSDNIEYWIAELRNTTLQVLFEKILTRGGILKYVMDSPHRFSLMQELETFFEFIKDESVKNPLISLGQFLDTVDMMYLHELPLPLNKSLYQNPGVNFVTAHSAKGLEYEHVFIIGCNENEWDKTSSRNTTYTFPDNMLTSLEGDQIEESRRLFYVALTRAKKQLVISYATANKDGKAIDASRFVEEMRGSGLALSQRIHLEDSQLLDFNMQVMRDEAPPVVKMLEESYMRKLLENYSLSVTHLNTYLKCPISFYFGYLLRVPTAKNQYMAFGSAVHFALERLFKRMRDNGNEFSPKTTLLQDFEWYMQRHQDSFTGEEYQRRLAYGREILPAYYDKYVGTWNKIVVVERNFRCAINGVPINGKLDKLEFDGHSVNVVDYKTGQYAKSTNRFDPPLVNPMKEDLKYEEQYGGDYWRQAVFYKLLVDNDSNKQWTAVSTEFDFIEPDSKTKEYYRHKVHIQPHDLEIVTQQLTDAYANIMALKFDKGCNDPDCKWCNFVKNNYALMEVGDEVEMRLEQ